MEPYDTNATDGAATPAPVEDPRGLQAMRARLREPRVWLALLLAATGALLAGLRIAQLEAALAGEGTVSVVMATRALPAGSALQDGDLAIRTLPPLAVHPKMIRGDQLDLLPGQVLSEGVAEGEVLLWSALAPEDERWKSLSGLVPVGERAVAVAVDSVGSVGYQIRPGDRIDMFLATSRASGRIVMPVLQNVSVLATGDQLVGQSGSGPYNRIVVSLTPTEAELMLLAQQVGRVHVLLRNRDDLGAAPDLPVLSEQQLLGSEVRQNVQRARNRRVVRVIDGSG